MSGPGLEAGFRVGASRKIGIVISGAVLIGLRSNFAVHA
jgi:hypothetical protein